jgi:hypothetical protein
MSPFKDLVTNILFLFLILNVALSLELIFVLNWLVQTKRLKTMKDYSICYAFPFYFDSLLGQLLTNRIGIKN